MTATTKTPIELEVSTFAFDFFAMLGRTLDGAADVVDYYLGRISEGNLEALVERTEESTEGWPDVRVFKRGPLAMVLAIDRSDPEVARVLVVGGGLAVA